MEVAEVADPPMTEFGGLEEAILLRLVDRLVMVEQQTTTSLATVGAMSDSIGELRKQIAQLSGELDKLRELSMVTMRSFEQMRSPLQGLLDLKQKFSGGWLVITAFFLAVAYLLQPLLTQLYNWRLGVK
jgi:uncharacterized coiled-coil protein SlyX